MTDIYKCKLCNQLWSGSLVGHGWQIYERLNNDFKYNKGAVPKTNNQGGVQINSKWGMRTNKQVRGQKKKRGLKD